MCRAVRDAWFRFRHVGEANTITTNPIALVAGAQLEELLKAHPLPVPTIKVQIWGKP